MKIVNKKTGEVIDLSNKSEEVKETPEQKTEKRIEERGKIQDSVKKATDATNSPVKRASGALETLGAPLSAVESAIANPSLEMQKGNFNPRDLMKEAILGLSLQKQGQYGDVMKNAGYNPILADSLGMVLNLSPIKVYGEVAKTFGNISKMSDKGLEKAGENLVYAVNQAKEAVGTKVTQEFAKGADNVPVDGIKFIDDIAKLPEPVMKRAEDAFGNLADFANGLTVGKVREFKRFLGKLKPNDYGKDTRGLAENIDVQDLNKVYSNLKTRMETTLRDKASGLDKKEVDHLMNLEESYADVVKAGQHIRKSIIDPTLKKATRVGEFAEKIKSDANATSRVALNEVKQASAKARDGINRAMKEIESYNNWKAAKETASRFVGAAVYGGAAGGVGARILKGANSGDYDSR
jgi:hypothetical protein